MKASAFAYARATSVANALELLAAHGDKAKVLSGGQSLMPAMNLRLISPELIVDIGELAELRGIAVNGERRHHRRADASRRSAEISGNSRPCPAADGRDRAMSRIRRSATAARIGGSLAHADPASELPACMVALDATIIVRGPGRRAADCGQRILHRDL